ncbi:uncharacterized protein [Chelonus insularis]|uniref:uncharacterized protein n=1 Tax=Chelonus insularis TaxID=460826 RepID=UPI001589B85F|nr:uncharacterized protein LOC118070199 [Chelonus insularis]
MDFLQKSAIVIDFAMRTWFFRDNPQSQFTFSPTIAACQITLYGLREVTRGEGSQLEQLLTELIPETPKVLNTTTMAVHDIDVGDSPATEQNFTQKVNAVTKKDAYPIRHMSDILDQLRHTQYITTLELSQAYYQIPLTERAKPITAFIVPGRGLFQFTRMPYGLTNAPATFQRLLDKVLGPEVHSHVFVHFESIVKKESNLGVG